MMIAPSFPPPHQALCAMPHLPRHDAIALRDLGFAMAQCAPASHGRGEIFCVGSHLA
jgi:hypothetical protein